MTTKRSATKTNAASRRKTGAKKLSGKVTRESHALSLEPDVFKSSSPRSVALSLKRSAAASRQRKGSPFQSAMSMLNFYINRAGHSLPAAKKEILQKAKSELRHAYGRE